MATAEVASASLAPRYAPDDPTLLIPWKGLIDGSTGLLYYWNPETDITQYERPASIAPLLPSASTPKLAPIPMAHTLQPNGMLAQQGNQMNQTPQQLGQQIYQHQDTQMVAAGPQQWDPRITQGMQQQGHQTPQYQGQQMPPQQVKQFPHQQLQQGPYQQTHYAPAHQNLQPHTQQIPYQQGQQFMPHQGQNMGFAQREENVFQQGKQVGFSPSQIQQASGTHFQIPQNVHSVPPQQFLNSSSTAPQTGIGSIHWQQVGEPLVQNHVRSKMGHGPPIGYKEDTRERAGNEFFFNSNKAGSMMAPQQPKLAALPMTQNKQEMRIPQTVTAGGPNSVAGNAIPPVYNHVAVGKTFTDNTPTITATVSSDIANLSPVEIYRQKHEVTATGGNVPAPFMTFEATGFPPEILREIHVQGFSSPTPIQAQTWPIALLSRDIVAIAKTGSGKTLGYLIPAFIHLKRCHNGPQSGPVVLVLAPTRELATQIQDEVIKFGKSSRISCTCLYGGAPKGPQLKELDRGTDIVVATPGRLNDILEMKKIDFHHVSFLVLDEADRMLDMGFEPQIRKIVNEIPPRRQTLMYTATWPKEVRKIAGDLLVNPVQVNIGNVDELAANKAITQYVELVQQMNKQRRLEQILRAQERGSKVIIFCATKRLCDQLARGIGRNFGAAAIHGDKSQGERDWVLNQFRTGKSPILVATDVAARGLDIKDIRVVINYDFPNGVEDYVHRIGRTGRAGATGISYTFFCDQDRKHAADLVKVLEGSNQQVPPEVREMAVHGGPSFGKVRGGMNRYDSGGGRFDSRGGRGGMRDGSFGGRGGRNDFGGRGNQGRGFSGPRAGPVGWGGHDRGAHDRRGILDRNRSKRYSPSPDRVRTWDYRRSRSRSNSHSRSSSRSRSRSWSRSRSPSRSHEKSHEQSSKQDPSGPAYEPPSESQMSPTLPSNQGDLFPITEPPGKLPVAESSGAAGGEPRLPVSG